MKQMKIIFILVSFIIICGCLHGSSSESRELSIVFEEGVDETSARNLITKYNLTIDKIREEPTLVNGTIKDIVVAYVEVSDDKDIDGICDDINKENSVWICTIEYPDV